MTVYERSRAMMILHDTEIRAALPGVGQHLRRPLIQALAVSRRHHRGTGVNLGRQAQHQLAGVGFWGNRPTMWQFFGNQSAAIQPRIARLFGGRVRGPPPSPPVGFPKELFPAPRPGTLGGNRASGTLRRIGLAGTAAAYASDGFKAFAGQDAGRLVGLFRWLIGGFADGLSSVGHGALDYVGLRDHILGNTPCLPCQWEGSRGNPASFSCATPRRDRRASCRCVACTLERLAVACCPATPVELPHPSSTPLADKPRRTGSG